MTAPQRAGAPGLLARLGRLLRDAWLVLGLTIALCIALELVYRAQGAARRAVHALVAPAPATTAVHPYAGQAWWPEWERRVLGRPRNAQYDPYRAFWGRPGMLPLAGIDSLGRRVTIQPPVPAGTRPLRIALLGGSTMWGYTTRDSFTIGAQLAQRLTARGLGPFEIVNLAQPSHNLTQETISLLLELRRGAVPDLVVFLDGNNDIGAAFEAGSAGHVLNEAAAAARWRNGERGPVAQIALSAARNSALVTRLLQAMGGPPDGQRFSSRPAAETCAEVAAEYDQLTRSVEALGREYGFATLFLWQPMLATTHKTLSPWERQLTTPSDRFDAMVRTCTDAAERTMAPRASSFVSLRGLFDRDTSTVFVDGFAHLTERANGEVADTLASLVLARLPLRQAVHR